MLNKCSIELQAVSDYQISGLTVAGLARVYCNILLSRITANSVSYPRVSIDNFSLTKYVAVNNIIFWEVRLRSPIEVLHSFGATYCLRLQNSKMDLRVIVWGAVDWIDLAQDRNQWRALVNKVKNFRVP
jgi:N6-adenosine-specific RNA methylase IME4